MVDHYNYPNGHQAGGMTRGINSTSASRHIFDCPTYGRNRVIDVSQPACEACPICRRERGTQSHQCNFSVAPVMNNDKLKEN